jgi:transcriptional regulator with XRE-family HTH domain
MLGEELRKAREAAGLTQQQVAARAQMDRAYVSEIERGKVSLSVERLFRLCEAIGIRPSVILARVERASLRQRRMR